jgi:hypothetical protein
MNWGTRIALVYIGFVLMIGALIVRTSMEHTDLESADYYEKELRFQDQIDGAEALLNSGSQPVVSITAFGVTVELPEQLSTTPQGAIVFYRPDDAALDRKFDLKEATSFYDSGNFSSGRYRVRIEWKNGNEKYYHESNIDFP